MPPHVSGECPHPARGHKGRQWGLHVPGSKRGGPASNRQGMLKQKSCQKIIARHNIADSPARAVCAPREGGAAGGGGRGGPEGGAELPGARRAGA